MHPEAVTLLIYIWSIPAAALVATVFLIVYWRRKKNETHTDGPDRDE